MMRCILFLSLLFIAGCTSETASLQPDKNIKDTRNSNSPQPTIQPTPAKQSGQLNQEEIHALNEALPKNVRQILEQAEEFELMSVGHKTSESPQNLEEDTIIISGFMKVPVVGTKITDDNVRREIIDALYDGVAHADGSNACFNPRHVIRAMSKGKRVELVICFECLNFRGNGPEGKLYGQITRSPQELFNHILTLAGVPLK